MERNFNIPITFAILDEVQGKDTRFLKIVIDVLHTGKNFNGSIFDEDVVNDAIPSIKNTPILGYILVDDDGDTDDFAAHEYKIVKQSEGYKYMYDGSAYGVIPESCNPRWINKVCDDGKLRKFLQVDALLWTKFERAVEIFQRDIVKGQSMELSNDFEGIENPDGSFTFTKFKFDGCCILSTSDPKIQPAMINSTAIACFSADTIASEIKEKLDEYASIINGRNENGLLKSKEEGGIFDLNKEQLDILSKYSIKPEALDFSVDDTMGLEEFEEKVAAFASANESNDDGNSVLCEDATTDFALNGAFETELKEALYEEMMEDEDWGKYPKYSFYDFDPELSEVYAYDYADWKIYGFTYSVNGDKVTVDFASKKRKKLVIADFDEGDKDLSIESLFTAIKNKAVENANATFMTEKEQFASQINELNGKYAKLEGDYNTLVSENNAKIAAEETAAKDSIFEMFEKELGNDAEFTALKENANEFSATEIENKCFMLVGKKKANFSRKAEKFSKVIIPESVPVIPNPYGDLFD